MPNKVKSGGTPCRLKAGDRWVDAYAHDRRGSKTYVTPRAGAKFFPYWAPTENIRYE